MFHIPIKQHFPPLAPILRANILMFDLAFSPFQFPRLGFDRLQVCPGFQI